MTCKEYLLCHTLFLAIPLFTLSFTPDSCDVTNRDEAAQGYPLGSVLSGRLANQRSTTPKAVFRLMNTFRFLQHHIPWNNYNSPSLTMAKPTWRLGKALFLLVAAALPLHISASPPIRVDLHASFPAAPYLIELL